MHNGGFSHRRVADLFRVNHSIIVRLMQRFRQTGNVTKLLEILGFLEFCVMQSLTGLFMKDYSSTLALHWT
jgi:hypothetical protein